MLFNVSLSLDQALALRFALKVVRMRCDFTGALKGASRLSMPELQLTYAAKSSESAAVRISVVIPEGFCAVSHQTDFLSLSSFNVYSQVLVMTNSLRERGGQCAKYETSR